MAEFGLEQSVVTVLTCDESTARLAAYCKVYSTSECPCGEGWRHTPLPHHNLQTWGVPDHTFPRRPGNQL